MQGTDGSTTRTLESTVLAACTLCRDFQAGSRETERRTTGLHLTDCTATAVPQLIHQDPPSGDYGRRTSDPIRPPILKEDHGHWRSRTAGLSLSRDWHGLRNKSLISVGR